MAKHFELSFTDSSFSWARKTVQIQQEAALDGLYVVRTSLPAADLSAEAAVTAYKSLAVVERAFRSLKTVDLQVRPNIPLERRACAGARLSMHARLLRRVAHAREVKADAV
jgi:transposase